MDYIISDECQKTIAGLTNGSVNPKFPNTNKHLQPLSSIEVAYEDILYAATNKKVIQKKWSDLWAKNN